jgi:nucleotide-binding universal stress UspA family protein
MTKVPGPSGKEVSYRNVISEGKPAQQIVELADKEKVDLVIMGPSRGAITGQVIRASSRPVLAIPQSESHLNPLQNISKILVTTDCSPYSKTVIDYAFKVKQLIDCELFLLYVIELSAGIKFGLRQGYFVDALSKMRTWAKEQLENLTPDQFVNDHSVHRLVEEGPVSDKIAECAEACGVNIVILGAPGYGPIETHFVGTIMNKVLTKVSRPILTVKI